MSQSSDNSTHLSTPPESILIEFPFEFPLEISSTTGQEQKNGSEITANINYFVFRSIEFLCRRISRQATKKGFRNIEIFSHQIRTVDER